MTKIKKFIVENKTQLAIGALTTVGVAITAKLAAQAGAEATLDTVKNHLQLKIVLNDEVLQLKDITTPTL
jgi:hypothetical protein